MPLLSIIIPVYNVASYLDECIKSVVEQSYTDVEIICVDDGSMDGSGLLLDEWSKRDGRISVIHQENKGVSSARNFGLKMAHGEYITFVDADDKVRRDIYTSSMKAICENRLDAYIFAFETFPQGKVESTGFKTGEVLTYHQLFDSNPQVQSRNSLCFNWRFVFRADVLKNNHILFNEHIAIGEDMIYNIDAICHSKRIMATDESLYLYRKDNLQSAMSLKFKPSLEASLVRMYDRKLEQLIEYGLKVHKSYVFDLAQYTIKTYLRMMVRNLYYSPEPIDRPSEIMRLHSLFMIKDAFRKVGFHNIGLNKKEYLFFLAQKYRMKSFLIPQYDQMFCKS